ncbi:Peptidoglycan/LPS O-acetylase OafA/YrhL, contains acyltransferase and SGNH-hydrolase domains [Pilibacter termitis]|uniref:Peptidoglycan/LPS O-acetylase OafA/YrhL, contains acyltransferase and SGNH-hydrolase domains n=1 Tax=Pilibacter termitis TaxID=263852 RepID=A0A1T4P8I2_9ENTE|nr:acyltransferase family protein [Pilibacter termitis]SJZ87769.1 Peptidoglycan/LPS O-acetylase OafA/YrhL, contains acyltransferase and SGNH-hydrolase domains [Pilibacter termitis]
MEKNRLTHSRYISGFDGIRTIAVIGVILYHLLPNVMRGGYLGVSVFFVVSGYLITDLLRIELLETKKIHIFAFYSRRMKRLYPALVAMLVVTSAYIRLFQSDLLGNLRGVVLSSLSYLNNWWQISEGSSYFAQFGNPSPFTHIWSLAVEGQYYFVWPIVFLLLIKILHKNNRVFLTLMFLAIVSFSLMAILFKSQQDPTRVYYGTDTRLFSILMGSALAFVWPSWHLKEEVGKAQRSVLNKTGMISLLILLASFVFMDDQASFTYRGGMLLVSFASMLFVATVAHPGSIWSKILSNPVMSYIGKRSYGIYLWQFPVMIFFEARVKKSASQSTVYLLLELLFILVISEISYRVIEIPLKNFQYKSIFSKVKEWLTTPFFTKEKIVVSLSFALCVVATVAFVTAPNNTLTADQQKLQKKIEENAKKLKEQKATTSSTTQNATSQTSEVKEGEVLDMRKGLTDEQLLAASKLAITGFGDSVMLDAAPQLQELFPLINIDANVGRQLYDSGEDLETLKNEGKLANTVLVSLGTNGSWTDVQFEEFMKIMGENRQIYWLNVHVPTREWQTTVNKSLNEMKSKYKNLHIIDWYGESKSHKDWFYDDNVHPNETGLPYYANLVARKLLNKEVVAETMK